MSDVFSHDYKAFPFMSFSAPHIAMIVLFAAASALLFIFRKGLYRLDQKFRLYMFLLLLHWSCFTISGFIMAGNGIFPSLCRSSFAP
ncbi:hypothetical protein [Cytobacillus sp. Bac17]|uniref:hypothetical protein n=1 Tax=Cytobacillus sp. Bac17 TaxID=2926008 RepID=UPI002119A638|nr:hypothetical protein [Cytobacillus sp. Bac17]